MSRSGNFPGILLILSVIQITARLGRCVRMIWAHLTKQLQKPDKNALTHMDWRLPVQVTTDKKALLLYEQVNMLFSAVPYSTAATVAGCIVTAVVYQGVVDPLRL